MREAVRLELAGFPHPFDLVFHPRKPSLEVDFAALRQEVKKAVGKCRTS